MRLHELNITEEAKLILLDSHIPRWIQLHQLQYYKMLYYNCYLQYLTQ